jgi:FAD:protein FMN transferase
MGTIVTIDVYGSGEATAAEIGEVRRQLVRARAILQRADAVFSPWQPGSAISRLRAGEITTAEAPAEVADVLSRCVTARELSGGWFDPWAMPGGIDPTGLVKGWAAQQALAAFTAPCIAGAMVNAAGDIASYGDPGTGEPFRVGIADPAGPRRLAEIVSLTGAIATSGSYERGCHLIDPYSARPAVRVGSASVTGPDLGLADALATALAVAGEPGLAFISPIDGYEALIIGLDGRRRRTEHFPLTEPQLPGTRRNHRPTAWPGVRSPPHPGSLCCCFQETSSRAPPSGEVAMRQRPPVDRAMESPIARPRPAPLPLCSARWNRSKSCGRCSAGMPGPLSSTASASRPPPVLTLIRTRPSGPA